MKCPLCKGEVDIYSVVEIDGEVKEWCGSCEGERHYIRIYSTTKEGVLKEWQRLNERR